MKNYIELTDKILKQLKQDCRDLNPERELDYKYGEGDDLPEMARGVEAVGLIEFDVVLRSDEGESWLQIEYYSKIEKTVIFDYDVEEVYDDLYSFAKQLAEYQKMIDERERTIYCLDAEEIELIQGALNLAIEHDQELLEEEKVNMLKDDSREYELLIKQYLKLSKKFNLK